MKKLTIILTVTFTSVILFVTVFLIAEYQATEIPEHQCKIVEGKIIRIEEGGVKDVVFKLDGIENSFYINRGLENKFNLKDLQHELLGKKITVYYSNHTNIFGGKTTSRQIRKLNLATNTIYTEY